jgi:hypothetical protein
VASQGKTQVARKHHYVSAGYLAQFTDTGNSKGLLCTLDFRTEKFFQAKPRDVAFEIDYNAIEVDGLPSDAYEIAQGRFEGEAIRQVRQICETGKLPDLKALSYIYNLITLFSVKNPAIRNSMARMQDTVNRQLMRIWTSNPTMCKKRFDEARKAGFITSDSQFDYEKLKDFVRRDAYTIKIHTHSHVLTEISVFDDLLPIVAQRYWSVMTVKPGVPDLITCDRPAPPQLNTDIIVFTLSPRHALLGATEPEASEEFEIGIRQVTHINMKLLNQANAQIYSRSPKIALPKNGQLGMLDMRQVFARR